MNLSEGQVGQLSADSSDASVPDSFTYQSDAADEIAITAPAETVVTETQVQPEARADTGSAMNGSFLEWSAIRDWVRSNAPNPVRSCDRCKRGISNDSLHYHCGICGIGNFDLCQSCFEQHLGCMDDSHVLTERTVRLGKIVEIKNEHTEGILEHGRTLSFSEDTLEPLWDKEESLGKAVDLYLKKQAYEKQHPAFHESRLMDRIFAGFGTTETGPSLCSSLLRNWTQINHLLNQNSVTPSFKDTLSLTQMAVLRILHEWWLAMIQDHQDIAKTIAALLAGCWIQDPDELRFHERAGVIGRADGNQYHHALWNLFWAEMFTLHIPQAGQQVPQSLVSVRVAASQAAASQRIGYVLRHHTLTPLWLKGKPRDTEANINIAFRIVSSIIASHVSPVISEHAIHASWSEQTRDAFARHFTSLSGIVIGQPFLLYLADLASAEHILGRRSLSATLEPCPWVSSQQNQSELPYFLWDVRKAMTVKTSELKFRPSYTAISHTWGRWRIADRVANIAGVPWPVPRNTRFAVEDLASILKKVPGGCSYVWLDLVSIPQVTEDENLAQIANSEIARQATIFGNAKHVMAWFSDMPDFGLLHEAVYWLACDLVEHPLSSLPGQYMHKTSRHSADFLQSNAAYPLTRSRFSVVDYNKSEWQNYIHEWFTSLWTLQETCMRPDMWLCTSDWKPLDFDLGEGLSKIRHILYLDGLLALCMRMIHKREAHIAKVLRDHEAGRDFDQAADQRFVDTPGAVKHLVDTMAKASMLVLLELSPLEILWLGDQRQCTSRRAEAIMSALGVTRWWADWKDSTNLVLGRYPLEFLEEVRQKFGDALFFQPDAQEGAVTEAIDAAIHHPLNTPAAIGSLLPFGKQDILRPFHSTKRPPTMFTGHASLATWQICVDGSVHIMEASIIASKEEMGKGKTTARNIQRIPVELSDMSMMAGRPRLTMYKAINLSDLREWISQSPHPLFAICTSRWNATDAASIGDPMKGQTEGVILREIRPDLLIKTGRFATTWALDAEYLFPEASDVNWVVL